MDANKENKSSNKNTSSQAKDQLLTEQDAHELPSTSVTTAEERGEDALAVDEAKDNDEFCIAFADEDNDEFSVVVCEAEDTEGFSIVSEADDSEQFSVVYEAQDNEGFSIQQDNADKEDAGPLSYRVKLFKGTIHTNWEDKGIGSCIYQLGKNGKPDQITVRSEKDDRVLLQHTVSKEQLYQQQKETLIVWYEDDNNHLALSFVDSDSCLEIWQYMTKSQRENETPSTEEEEIVELEMPRSLFVNQEGDDESEVESRPFIKDGSSSSDHDAESQYACSSLLTRYRRKEIALPEPDLSNLEEILNALGQTSAILEKDETAHFFSKDDFSYLDKLLKMFTTCRDSRSIASLQILYKVTIAILNLEDRSIIEHLIADEQFETFMDILKCTPYRPARKAKSQKFIDSIPPRQYKIVTDLLEEKIVMKNLQQVSRLKYLYHVIQQQTSLKGPPPDFQQIFRLKYLRRLTKQRNPVNEPRWGPDPTEPRDPLAEDQDDDDGEVQGALAIIGKSILELHNEFVTSIECNVPFLKDLFQLYREHQKQQQLSEEQIQIIQFIGQTCQLAEHLDGTLRTDFYRALGKNGLFDIMGTALWHNEYRSTYLTILANCVDADVDMVRLKLLEQRRYLTAQHSGNATKLADTKPGSDMKEAVYIAKNQQQLSTKSLFEIIVQEFTSDTCHDSKFEYHRVLKMLLDPTKGSVEAGSPSAGDGHHDSHLSPVAEFVQEFYKNELKILMSPLDSIEIEPISVKGLVKPLQLTQHQAGHVTCLCQFLSFAVKMHGDLAKNLVLQTGLFKKLLQLYRSEDAYLKLAALQFFRTCVSLNDDFYCQMLIQQNTFEPAIRVFLDTRGKESALNSAFLQLLKCIIEQSIELLIIHLIKRFPTMLETVRNVKQRMHPTESGRISESALKLIEMPAEHKNRGTKRRLDEVVFTDDPTLSPPPRCYKKRKLFEKVKDSNVFVQKEKKERGSKRKFEEVEDDEPDSSCSPPPPRYDKSRRLS